MKLSLLEWSVDNSALNKLDGDELDAGRDWERGKLFSGNFGKSSERPSLKGGGGGGRDR